MEAVRFPRFEWERIRRMARPPSVRESGTRREGVELSRPTREVRACSDGRYGEVGECTAVACRGAEGIGHGDGVEKLSGNRRW